MGESTNEKKQLNQRYINYEKISINTGIIVGITVFSCTQKQVKVSTEEAKQIAEEAYIFAYPMIDHYKMMFAMAMYPESGAYNGPFNVLYHDPELSGPKDTIIVRPNNDTFYSAVWFDLTKQPQILEVPAITDGRYYSFQIIDLLAPEKRVLIRAFTCL